MFPEYRELISQLKTTHPRFHSLFDKHNKLDHEVMQLENSNASSEQITPLKKEKLRIKDELYRILLEESKSNV